MGLKLLWSPVATDQLKDVYLYHKKWGKERAQKIVDSIKKESIILSVFPKMGQPLSGWKNKSVRMILIKKYRLIYRVKSNNLEILRVYPASYSNYEKNLHL